MGSVRLAALALIAVLASAGCRSPDYGHARRTRFERAYYGGAASVPDARSDPPYREPTTFDVLAFFGVFALAFTHGVDHVGPLASDVPPPRDP